MPPPDLPRDRFALSGTWSLNGERALLASGGGAVQARFRAGKAYITASSGEPVAVSVAIDSHEPPPVLIQESRLYTVFDGDAYGEHTLAVDVPKPGFEAFTLSFG